MEDGPEKPLTFDIKIVTNPIYAVYKASIGREEEFFVELGNERKYLCKNRIQVIDNKVPLLYMNSLDKLETNAAKKEFQVRVLIVILMRRILNY